MKKSVAAILLAAGAIVSPSFAKVSFSLDIESLTASGGGELSSSGLLVLVVDAGDDGFALPSSGSFGEEVVAKWDLSTAGPSTRDITLSAGGVSYGGSWDVGDPLALLWFPALGAADTPSGSEPYGIFTDPSGITSGDEWLMPADGAILHSLKLFTATSSKLVELGHGEVPVGAGVASYAVGGNSPADASAPSALAVANSGNGSINLTWDAASGALGGYIIQRKATGDPDSAWETVGFADGSASTFSDGDVRPGLAYDYQILAQTGFGSAESDLKPEIEAERSYFRNVSARSKVLAGAASKMFGGFRVAGNDPNKNILVQALGESFFGGDVFITDPTILMVSHPNPDFSNTEDVVDNDDWLEATNATSIEDATANVGLAMATDSKDAAGLISAARGVPYTFTVDSKSGDEKDVVLGIFNADYKTGEINDNRLVNLSARGYLGTAASEILAGGVIIEGNVPKEVLVMAWGPYLGGLGLSGTVPDPTLKLTLLSDPDTIIASNDNWQTQVATAGVEVDLDRISAALSKLGYLPFADGSKDALLLVTLNPGAYVFQVDDAGGSDGLALISLDEVEMN